MPAPTPDDLLAAETPRDFPEAMRPVFSDAQRRRERHLAAEDTNAVFRLFAQRPPARRIVWRWGLDWDNESVWMIANTGYLLTILALQFGFLSAGMSDVAFQAAAALMTLAVIPYVYHWIRGAQPVPQHRKIPRSVTGMLYGPGTPALPTLIDLWQCGLRGREILEAFYLDQRRKDAGTALATTPLIVATLASFAGVAANGRMDTPPGIVYLAGLSSIAVFFYLWANRLNRPYRRTARIAAGWYTALHTTGVPMPPVTPWHPVDEDQHLVIGVLRNVLVAFIGVLLVSVVPAVSGLSLDQRLSYWGVLSLVASSVAIHRQRALVPIKERRLDDLLVSVNPLFDEYVRVVLLGDHERR